MKCYCCDVILTPQESTRKFKESGSYVDMCNKCLVTIDDQVEYDEGVSVEDEDGYDEDCDLY